MTYPDLVTRMSELSEQSPEVVRRILDALPGALVALPPGGRVRTPLGFFEAIRRTERLVKPPNGGPPARVAAQIIVKLRPGPHLRRPTY